MTKKKIIVLGGGRIGKVIARDLIHNSHKVKIADKEVFPPIKDSKGIIEYEKIDLTDINEVIKLIEPYDLVICAVPGFMGYNLLKTVISSGKNVVDVSFFPEDPMTLNTLAKKTGSVVVVDCGVAPGMSNIIFGYLYNNVFNVTESFECLVGGLPKEQIEPYYYKAPFSPIDVIEEYTRVARYREENKLKTIDPFDTIERVYFPGVGVLESIITDGLRTLLSFDDVPKMVEKTLRYPGHLRLMKIYKELGLFDKEYIDMTSKLLFPKWKLTDTDQDITIMEIKMSGYDRYGLKMDKKYLLYDEYDEDEKISSMSRTTGYVTSAIAGLVLNGDIVNVGINKPEVVGMEIENFDKIIEYLKNRNVIYKIL